MRDSDAFNMTALAGVVTCWLHRELLRVPDHAGRHMQGGSFQAEAHRPTAAGGSTAALTNNKTYTPQAATGPQNVATPLTAAGSC